MSLRDIAKEVGWSHWGIDVMLRGQVRVPKTDTWTLPLGHLTVSEREEILLGLQRGQAMRAIAMDLDRSSSTVSREVTANGGRDAYRVWPAHARA
jgi:IS30 family transposase